MEAEKLTVTCEVCGGDGGFDDGARATFWQVCIACAGKGEYEVEALPIECDDDLEERNG